MELFRALGALVEEADAERARIGELLGLPGRPDPADHTELFVIQLPPHASIYVGGEGMLGGEARDRVAGFWRALRRSPPAEPDHLALLLAMYAEVAERAEDPERGAGDADVARLADAVCAEGAETTGDETDEAGAARWRHVRRALLWEHLLCWVPVYLERIRALAPPFYAAWADLLERALVAEAEAVGPPARLPLHLRAAPGPPEADEGELDALLGAVLAPVRSGVVIARADLKRAAGEVGVALRMGERRYILKHLLGQDADAMLAWLSREAVARAGRYGEWPAALDPVADFWSARAEAGAAALDAIRARLSGAGAPKREEPSPA